MIVVPSISPATMSTVRPRRRGMLRSPSLRKIGLRAASSATIRSVRARNAAVPMANGPVGMPKSLVTARPLLQYADGRVGVGDAVAVAAGRRAEDGRVARERLRVEACPGVRLRLRLGVPEGDEERLAVRIGEDVRAAVAVQLAQGGHHLPLV